MTFEEFIRNFSTEEQCRDFLFRVRFPNGFVCPKCGHGEYWKVGELLHTCKNCRLQTSIIAGTVFENTRKSLKTWFIAIWWVTTQKSGASAEGLKQVLGLRSDQTAWTWLHKIRKAMVNPNRTKLSGTVEVDETFIDGVAKGKHGRGAENKVLVIIATEFDGKKLGHCRMGIIEDGSVESIHPFIIENIEAESTLITDGWKGYNGIEKKNYIRNIHVQTGEIDETKMLPHIHTIASLLKRWLLGTHQGAVTEKHFQAYLYEYVFRFNRRKSA